MKLLEGEEGDNREFVDGCQRHIGSSLRKITVELETDFQPRVDASNTGLSQCFDS